MERTTSKFLSCAPGWMVAPLVGWRKDGKLAVVGSGGGGQHAFQSSTVAM